MSFPTPLVLFPLIFPTPSPSVLAIQLGLAPIFPFLHSTCVLLFLRSHTPTPGRFSTLLVSMVIPGYTLKSKALDLGTTNKGEPVAFILLGLGYLPQYNFPVPSIDLWISFFKQLRRIPLWNLSEVCSPRFGCSSEVGSGWDTFPDPFILFCICALGGHYGEPCLVSFERNHVEIEMNSWTCLVTYSLLHLLVFSKFSIGLYKIHVVKTNRPRAGRVKGHKSWRILSLRSA